MVKERPYDPNAIPTNEFGYNLDFKKLYEQQIMQNRELYKKMTAIKAELERHKNNENVIREALDNRRDLDHKIVISLVYIASHLNDGKLFVKNSLNSIIQQMDRFNELGYNDEDDDNDEW